MHKIIFILLLLVVQVTYAKAQLWLSPVNTGDCVAARISAKKNSFVVELDKKYCARNLPDKTKEKVCLENSRGNEDFSFFTDRCSESDYFIGINGEEVRLRRVSKKTGKAHYFIGSYAGKGFNIDISHPRLIKKTYVPGEPRNEDNVDSASYKILITIKRELVKRPITGFLHMAYKACIGDF